MLTILITAALAFITMSVVYWIIQKAAEWFDEHHTYKWEKEADKRIHDAADEAIKNIQEKHNKKTG